MRAKTVIFCALSLITLPDQAGEVVFPRLISLDEEDWSRARALDEEEFAKESMAFATAASLKTPRSSGPFEVRILRVGVMSGSGVAYVLAGGLLRAFHIDQRPDGGLRARQLTSRRTDAGKLPFTEVQALKEITGQWSGCGVEDGESVLIDASLNDVPIQVEASNPTDCTTSKAHRIMALLNAITALDKRSPR